jgi:hypothetical protein
LAVAGFVTGDDWLRRVIRDYMLTRLCIKAFHFGWLGLHKLLCNAEFLSGIVRMAVSKRFDRSSRVESFWQDAGFMEI